MSATAEQQGREDPYADLPEDVRRMIPDGAGEGSGEGGDEGAGDAEGGRPPRQAEPRERGGRAERDRGATIVVGQLRPKVTHALYTLALGWVLAHQEDLEGMEEPEAFERYLTTACSDHFDDHRDHYDLAGLIAQGIAQGLGLPDSQQARTKRDHDVAQQQNEADRAHVAVAVAAGQCRPEVLRDMPKVDE